MNLTPFEIVIFCGLPASGKSTFYRERFAATHRHISLDALKTRKREAALLRECIENRWSCVVDNTNVTSAERLPYIEAGKAAGARIAGYCFRSALAECLARNARREGKARIKETGLYERASKLAFPSPDEGFDALCDVWLGSSGFNTRPWISL